MYLPGEGDGYCDHNYHVDETGAHKISREHPVPLARVLQQVIKTMAISRIASTFWYELFTANGRAFNHWFPWAISVWTFFSGRENAGFR